MIDIDPRGHYRAAGGAVGFVGAVGLGVAAVSTWLVPQSLGFIDATALTGFSVLFLAVAARLFTVDPHAS